jgi:hypothetical protein
MPLMFRLSLCVPIVGTLRCLTGPVLTAGIIKNVRLLKELKSNRRRFDEGRC